MVDIIEHDKNNLNEKSTRNKFNQKSDNKKDSVNSSSKDTGMNKVNGIKMMGNNGVRQNCLLNFLNR